MPRAPRVVIPGCPHHVTQRGNNRGDVFFTDDDRRRFLRQLDEATRRFGVAIEAYCLMANHYHLIAVPQLAESLQLALKRMNQLYAQFVNRVHGRSGHLWQDRFYSCPLDRPHFGSALVYVERNPVRAKLAERAWEWPWSSAAAHCGANDPPAILDLRQWRQTPNQWRRALSAAEDDRATRALRLCTNRGRPFASDGFLSKLEQAVGRRLRPLPPGRPRKPKPTAGTKREN